MEFCWSFGCFGTAITLFIVYKVLDRLIRWPTVGKYSDRYILITGCSAGFGQAATQHLDKLGCHVFAGCTSDPGEQELIRTCSDRLVTFKLDITNHDSILKAFELVKSKLPPGKGLWGLVNNAGISGACCPGEWLSVEEYRRVANVNLFGTIDMTMTFLPLIKRARGRVINIGSASGRITFPVALPYSVTKFGIESFTDGLRFILKPYGGKAICLEPGFFRTKMTNRNQVRDSFLHAWERAPAEVKEDFGEDYFEKRVPFVLQSIETATESNLDLVNYAIEHSLLGRFPRARYVVGYVAHFLWIPLSRLPEWLADWLIMILSVHPPMHVVDKKKYN